MANIEVILLWITVFSYVAVFCLQLFGFVVRKDRIVNIAFRLMWVAFVVHTATGIVRWIAGGHPPVTDGYELNLTGTWFTVFIFLLFVRFGKAVRSIGLVLMPIVFFVLGYGFMMRGEAIPMNPAYNSPWLVVHVIFAWLAFGCYAIATGAAVLLLLKKKRPASESFKKIPGLEDLDLLNYRFIVLGFINHAIMLVSGALWAKQLWGQYWSWDALETWSLISFLTYALILHARSFLGWKMQKAAWLTVLGLLILAISFWGVGLFSPSVHPVI